MNKLTQLKQLLSPISDSSAENICDELITLYTDLNGFVGFEGALLCFPSNLELNISLKYMNDLNPWKYVYCRDVQETFFFSADIFGHLFGVLRGGIMKFNPETGIIEKHSESIEEWASVIISNYDYETGWSLARDWQKENGPLNIEERLLPKVPFSIGGEYEISNLTVVKLNEAMKQYSNLFIQVKSAKKGESISIYGWLES